MSRGSDEALNDMSSDNPDLSLTPAAANRFYSPLPVPANHNEHDASTEVNGIFGRPTPAENDSGKLGAICKSATAYET